MEIKKTESGYWPRSEEELLTVIRDAMDQSKWTTDGYSASAEAMTTAAVAAFNYVSHVQGNTGFQAGWASMQFLRQTKGIKGPFAIMDFEQCLYPQSDPRDKVDGWFREMSPALAKMAKEKIEEAESDKLGVHPNVLYRWYEAATEWGESLEHGESTRLLGIVLKIGNTYKNTQERISAELEAERQSRRDDDNQ